MDEFGMYANPWRGTSEYPLEYKTIIVNDKRILTFRRRIKSDIPLHNQPK